MFDDWSRLGPLRRAYYRWLTKQWSVATVHSEACLSVAQLALPELPCICLRFGISRETFFKPVRARRAGERLRIVAAGNDQARDWDLVLQAFGNQPAFELMLLTRQPLGWAQQQYDNVSIIQVTRVEDWKKIYDLADYVCVPMKENRYSGITVALEAAARGVPIVSTRTGGIPTYFDDTEVLYSDVGDPEAMRRKVLEQTDLKRLEMTRRAQQRFERMDYSTRGLAYRYALITEALVNGSRDQAGVHTPVWIVEERDEQPQPQAGTSEQTAGPPAPNGTTRRQPVET